MNQARIDAAVLIDLGERAALQYRFVQGETVGGEAWLDAYGFNAAAQSYAEGRLEAIAAEDPTLAAGLRTMLSRMQEAFSAFDGPGAQAPAAEALTSAVEAARGAL